MGNPVIPVYAADPHAELIGARYYIYATNAGVYTTPHAFHKGELGELHGFAVWSSPDLVHWESDGRVLTFADVPWAKDLAHAWAPCLAQRNGKFYFYYCADSRMGVAVGDSPTGPFHDVLGAPLVDFREDMSAIDPMVFIDDDGQAYFYWGAVPGAWLEGRGFEIRTHLSVCKLNSDMVSFGGPEIHTIETQKSPDGWHSIDHIEASHVFKRNGIYYLMWSPGGFASNKDDEAYRVHYATSSSPLGPWTLAKNNPVLTTRREIDVVGPGHHSTIQLPGTDIWYCIYHCHKGDADRRVFIDRMTFAEDGSIEAIIPTLEGASPHPVGVELRLEAPGPYTAGTPIRLNVSVAEGIEWAHIEFLANGNVIGSQTNPNLGLERSDLVPGFYRLSAKVQLTSGEVLVTTALDIDVV